MDPDKKYYLKNIVSCYKRDGWIFIGFPIDPANLVKVEDNDEQLADLYALTGKGLDKAAIAGKEFLRQLLDLGYLSLSKPGKKDRINRNELFIDYLNTLSDEEEQVSDLEKSLRTKRVLILGCGAGGAMQCYQLAQFGFKKITIIDFDKVTQSDMLRVPVWNKKDIGKKKVLALQSKIKENFGIRIKTGDHRCDAAFLRTHLAQNHYDLIIKAMDPDFGFSLDLAGIARAFNIPHISIAYSYQLVKIGPMVIPHRTIDEEIIEEASARHYGPEYPTQRFEKLLGEYLIHPSVNFNVCLTAGFAFKEILFFLLDKPEFVDSIEKQIVYAPMTNEVLIYDYKSILPIAEKREYDYIVE